MSGEITTSIRDYPSRVKPTQKFLKFPDSDAVEQQLTPKTPVSREGLEVLAGRTSQLEIINLGGRQGDKVYPFDDSSQQLNAELRKIEELKSWKDESQAIELLKKSVLAKVFPETIDEAGGKLANSTNFLHTPYPDRNFDLNVYLSASYLEFSANEPRKYEYAIEKFNDHSLVRDILQSKKSSSDIYRMLVNLTNHLIQSQAAARYERESQELDATPSPYSDRKSSAAK